MHGLHPVASAIARDTITGLPGALFAMLLFLAGQQQITVDPQPGPLAWTAFRLAIGPALLFTARSPFGRRRRPRDRARPRPPYIAHLGTKLGRCR